MMLMLASLIAVLYIANAIAVNDLMVDITSLERERDVVLRENEQLRADLLRLMSVDRIAGIATRSLGLTMPLQPPRSIPSLSGKGNGGPIPATLQGR